MLLSVIKEIISFVHKIEKESKQIYTHFRRINIVLNWDCSIIVLKFCMYFLLEIGLFSIQTRDVKVTSAEFFAFKSPLWSTVSYSFFHLLLFWFFQSFIVVCILLIN